MEGKFNYCLFTYFLVSTVWPFRLYIFTNPFVSIILELWPNRIQSQQNVQKTKPKHYKIFQKITKSKLFENLFLNRLKYFYSHWFSPGTQRRWTAWRSTDPALFWHVHKYWFRSDHTRRNLTIFRTNQRIQKNSTNPSK